MTVSTSMCRNTYITIKSPLFQPHLTIFQSFSTNKVTGHGVNNNLINLPFLSIVSAEKEMV